MVGVELTVGALLVTVTVLGLVLVLVEAGGTAVVVVLVVTVVLAVVDEVVVDDAAAITPQATRLPASPVAMVSASGPGAPSFWV